MTCSFHLRAAERLWDERRPCSPGCVGRRVTRGAPGSPRRALLGLSGASPIWISETRRCDRGHVLCVSESVPQQVLPCAAERESVSQCCSQASLWEADLDDRRDSLLPAPPVLWGPGRPACPARGPVSPAHSHGHGAWHNPRERQTRPQPCVAV